MTRAEAYRACREFQTRFYTTVKRRSELLKVWNGDNALKCAHTLRMIIEDLAVEMEDEAKHLVNNDNDVCWCEVEHLNSLQQHALEIVFIECLYHLETRLADLMFVLFLGKDVNFELKTIPREHCLRKRQIPWMDLPRTALEALIACPEDKPIRIRYMRLLLGMGACPNQPGSVSPLLLIMSTGDKEAFELITKHPDIDMFPQYEHLPYILARQTPDKQYFMKYYKTQLNLCVVRHKRSFIFVPVVDE